MPKYTAYGLTIESSFRIPELAVSHRTHTDVRIHRASVPPVTAEEPGAPGIAYRVGETEMVYSRPGWGRFLVRDGRDLFADPAPQAEDRIWRLSLLGPALGLLLFQRGYLVLHGGAVVLGGGATLLLGASGSGKSTLTGELCQRGAGLLTDDVVAVDMSGRRPRVVPGIPFLKLWPDSVPMAPDGIDTTVLHPDFDKVGRRLADAALADAAPMDRIFVLAGGREVSTEPLVGARAFQAVMSSLFAVRYGKKFLGSLDGAMLLRDVSRILEGTPIAVLRRPRDHGLLSRTAEVVMASASASSLRSPLS